MPQTYDIYQGKPYWLKQTNYVVCAQKAPYVADYRPVRAYPTLTAAWEHAKTVDSGCEIHATDGACLWNWYRDRVPTPVMRSVMETEAAERAEFERLAANV